MKTLMAGCSRTAPRDPFATRKEPALNRNAMTRTRSTGVAWIAAWMLTAAIGLTPEASGQTPNQPPAGLLPSQRFTPPSGVPPLNSRPAAQLPGTGPERINTDRAATDLLRADPLSQARLFMAKARAEMQAGNLPGATFWHDKAVQTGAAFPPGEDSPAKLAEDLRTQGAKVSALPPMAKPLGALPEITPGTGDLGRPQPYPQANVALQPAAAPSAYPATSSPLATNPGGRPASDSLLLQARKALAVGDVRRATEAVTQAKALKVSYDFYEDSPAKVEAAINKFADLQQRSATDRDSEGYRRRFAELQMQQAEELLRWKELDEAERLVNEAKRMGVTYNPYETKPDVMLQRIADARKPGAVRSLEPLPPANVISAAPSPIPTVTDAKPVDAGPADRKAKVVDLVGQARAAMKAGDIAGAERFAQEAESMRVPDTVFAPQDDRPYLVLLDISKIRGSSAAAASASTADNRASNAVYNPAADTTKNMPVASQIPLQEPTRAALPAGGQVGIGMSLFMEGEEALKAHDVPKAMTKFREAQKFAAELDPVVQQRLQDYLVSGPGSNAPGRAPQDSLIRETSANSQLVYKQVSAEIARQEQVATQVRETDPKRAAAILRQSREQVERSPLDPAAKDLLLRRLDRSIADLQSYLDVNRAKIELEERNRTVRSDIERDAQLKVEVDEKIALKVEEFNQYIDQQQFAQAELVAKQLKELAPNEPIVKQIQIMANYTRAARNSESIRYETAVGTQKQYESIAVSNIPMDDRNPYVMPDAKEWKKMSDRRASLLAIKSRKTDKELEIEQRLRTPVSLKFKDAPLQEVISRLAVLAQINMHLDPQGMVEEGVATDTPVTIDLSQEISLKSALSLILKPLHLSYVIRDEVLKITSETLRDGEVYSVTYNVADLVIPIPNFVPNSKMGLAGALDSAYQAMGFNANSSGMSPLAAVASNDGAVTNAQIDPRLLGQINLGGGGGVVPIGRGGGGGATGFPQQVGFGPGAMGAGGGGAQADFDQLIQLIQGTIAPTTWSDVGGAGAIRPFPTNLSLVISQTQQVHEEIADLLEQLRRLQDLQVTIEVRFISLADNFFEQMGVDFDFDINDYADKPGQIFGRFNPRISTAYGQPTGANTDYPRDVNDRDLTSKTSATVGVSGAGAGNQLGAYSNDLDIPFRQSSFTQAGLITTGTAGAGVVGGAQLGFAILSDLEAYFFMSAVQSDTRTNVLQAPKVTLFNGQQAFVSDTAQTPFVISVVPVVGDFAAAQQPVIVVLSEGTFLTVQAVVSSDRRFVRLTVVPFFSRIGEVNTFTFTGASSSTRTSSSDGPEDETTDRAETVTDSREGTTVQLPTFAFTTVTTTVSVPDGGTVLLGGIKRLSEQRLENGVPVLSKIPYINRLFTNIGTGRATSSLMMMVTPRIIIQEEEEALLGVVNQP